MTLKDFYKFYFGKNGFYILCPLFFIHWAEFAPEITKYTIWRGIQIGIWPIFRGFGYEFEFKWFLKLVTFEISYYDIVRYRCH